MGARHSSRVSFTIFPIPGACKKTFVLHPAFHQRMGLRKSPIYMLQTTGGLCSFDHIINKFFVSISFLFFCNLVLFLFTFTAFKRKSFSSLLSNTLFTSKMKLTPLISLLKRLRTSPSIGFNFLFHQCFIKVLFTNIRVL